MPTMVQPSSPPPHAVSTWSGSAREEAVQQMFTAIARWYDLNNSLLSFGLHHAWKRRAIACVPSKPEARVLDLGAGTGDLAIGVARRLDPTGHVLAADLNRAMLQVGVQKIFRQAPPAPTTCLQMNAERLTLRDASVDAVTAGFCIRNVGDRMRAFREIYRVLKPGGRFVCLEFSRPVYGWLRGLYDWYSFHLLPWIGRMVARDRTGVYEYLPASIRTFPDQEQLCGLLKEAGFRTVEYRNLTGGIVAIHVATK